jgi:hypothetical protein
VELVKVTTGSTSSASAPLNPVSGGSTSPIVPRDEDPAPPPPPPPQYVHMPPAIVLSN